MMAQQCLVLVAAVVLGCSAVGGAFDRQAALAKVPRPATLHAPYTPFLASGAIDYAAVPTLAATAAKFGVNVVWCSGSMSQFYEMDLEERKTLCAAWVEAAHKHGMYVIVHVGTTVLSDAIELAEHAVSVGADAVASVPPYYSKPSNDDALFHFLRPIADAAPDLPLFYYHIPGMTGYDTDIAGLMEAAISGEKRLPTLLGIKFVSPNNLDWFNCVSQFNDTAVFLAAPEPKLQSFGLGLGSGGVLAEDFFAPTYLRMRREFAAGNHEAARKEQQWKYSVMDVFSKYGGGEAERAVYKELCGVDMGAPRPPAMPFDSSQYTALVNELRPLGFFNQTAPPRW